MKLLSCWRAFITVAWAVFARNGYGQGGGHDTEQSVEHRSAGGSAAVYGLRL
ncbi:hypothetical protein AB0H86_26275 [Streptomyces sp. NPDC050997]|uniref:hypothetical protein n=1 Tax=Streptomyces sp. NPDC050997 TaxID=3155519 RepID=UPI0034457504